MKGFFQHKKYTSKYFISSFEYFIDVPIKIKFWNFVYFLRVLLSQYRKDILIQINSSKKHFDDKER